jgi:hypothetical protein
MRSGNGNDLRVLTLRRREAPSRRVSPNFSRESDEDESVGMGGNIVEMKRAFPLLGAVLAEG